jgi:hypothetical protein
MMNIVDTKGYPDVPKGRDLPPPSSFNPIRWLAQVLPRTPQHTIPLEPAPQPSPARHLPAIPAGSGGLVQILSYIYSYRQLIYGFEIFGWAIAAEQRRERERAQAERSRHSCGRAQARWRRQALTQPFRSRPQCPAPHSTRSPSPSPASVAGSATPPPARDPPPHPSRAGPQALIRQSGPASAPADRPPYVERLYTVAARLRTIRIAREVCGTHARTHARTRAHARAHTIIIMP